MDRIEEIQKILEKNGITSVRFEQSDMYGVPHCRRLPTKHFKRAASKGLNMALCFLAFDPKGYIAENSGYSEEPNCKDCVAYPDLDTFQIIPWCKNTASVLLEGVFEGEKVAAYPRVVARRQLEKLKEHGLSLWSAHEHEFYMVRQDTMKPIHQQTNAMAVISMHAYESFYQQVVDDLPKAGVDIECFGEESGKGQLEITYRPEFGIKAADVAHMFKLGIKEIALSHGFIASFMTKPWPDSCGSSAHYCHSLWDVDGKVSMLYDKSRASRLSEIGEHWVAGLLAHAKAIAVLMAPTVNCVTRYKRHSFAPWNVTWGPDNRTCALRVKINGERGTYIENRMGASGCNPYISMAATIAAGLDGVIKKLPLPKGIEGNAYKDECIPPGTQRLPDNMEDAVEALLADDVITSALGPDFIKCFVATKRHEMKLEIDAMFKGNRDEWQRDFLFYMV